MLSTRRLLVATLGLFGCSASSTRPRLVDVRDPTYTPGQVWAYRTRPGEDSSTLTILKVERADTLGTIVHVSVSGLAIRNPGAPDGVIHEASHLPFAKEAVDRSVVRRLRAAGPLPAFQQGYDEWRRAFDAGKGGIFTITVAEAVALFEPRPGK
jgi:hypothetical protein